MKGYIDVSVDGNVATVTFSHPSHNSLSSDLLADLAFQISSVASNTHISAIVLQAAGDRTFCAGANFEELSQIRNAEDGKEFFLGFANVINAIRTCGKLVIGRIQGKAVGGGVGLIAACDYVMATKWGSVRLSELAIGLGPFVIGPAIRRKIGLGHFSQLALNPSEWQTASWCKEVGLYNELFAEIEQLDDYLSRYLQKLSSYSYAALSAMKQSLWKGTEDWNKLLEKNAALSGELVILEASQQAIGKKST